MKHRLNFYRLFWMFVLGAFLGDMIETVFCLATTGKLMSRSSVIYGPFSVVWGFGIVFLTIALSRLAGKRDLYIFLSGTVLGGVYEYLCSLLTELLFGARFWDYSGIPFNLHGRVNLLYCFFWGLIALLWVQNLYPWLSVRADKIMIKMGRPMTVLICAVMCANMFISAAALNRARERESGAAPSGSFERFLDSKYPDERMLRVYPNIKFF